MDQSEIDLSRIEILVIDEADRMFDMGFLPDIKKILKCLPVKRQTLLFSATMPDEVRQLAEGMLHDPVIVRIGECAPISTVSHAIYPVDPQLKASLLMRIMNCTDMASVLIFTRTKDRATRLAKQIKKSGFPAASLQGDLSHNKRQEAINGFRSGKYQFLVATDIAARGIDVSKISHVINYDMPDTVVAYTHRIGRAGRATRKGDAFNFVTGQDRSFVWAIEKAIGEKLERRILENFDYTLPLPEGGDGSKPSLRPGKLSHLTKASKKTLMREGRPSSPVLRPVSSAKRGRRDLSNFTVFADLPQVKARRSRSIR
jgi:ATP-dependent RNA helicase RhlE